MPSRDFETLDLSRIPQECDYIVYHVNGGLVISANVGGSEDYGNTVQEALDNAIDHYLIDCEIKDIL